MFRARIAAGKTNLLDIIENVGHALYRKPDYSNLKRVVNQNSGSPIISFKSEFILEGSEYEFSYIIDVEEERYIQQKLVDVSANKLLYNYENKTITSDVLSGVHINALKGFNICKKGVIFYINELEEDVDTKSIQKVRRAAKHQDFIELELGNIDTVSAIKKQMVEILNELDIDVRDIQIQSKQNTFKKMTQTRRADRKKKTSIEHNEDIDLIFRYDNYEQNIKDESRGTVKIFDLCVELLAKHNDDYFVPRLIDEMSTSLSSETFFYILNQFLDKTERQIVFTTNNLLLLENKTLPKESILFVEKTDKGSVISKLSDYKFVRNDKRHNWRKLFMCGQLSCKCEDK